MTSTHEVAFFAVNPVSQMTSSWGFRIEFCVAIVTDVRAARFVCPTRLKRHVGISDLGDDAYRVPFIGNKQLQCRSSIHLILEGRGLGETTGKVRKVQSYRVDGQHPPALHTS